MLSIQLTAKQQREEFEVRIAGKSILVRILAGLTDADDFVEGLVKHEADLLALVGADGAAILHDGSCRLLGQTPDPGR